MISRLALGTAQFGVYYGISNTVGKTPMSEAAAIMKLAAENSICILDTSPSYGDSEAVLGSLLPAAHSFRIVTKTCKFMREVITESDATVLEETFLRSLEHLNQPSVYGLLVHQLDDLLVHDGALLMQKALALKECGLVKKIGVSLSRFTERQLDQILEKYAVDLIQFPLNVLDQRLLVSGRLRELKCAGVELHARSIFLQGLLLLEAETLPSWFGDLKDHLRQYHDESARLGLSPVRAALDFVLGQEEIDAIICGVNNAAQLRELISCVQQAAGAVRGRDFRRFAIDDDRFINATNWRLQAE